MKGQLQPARVSDRIVLHQTIQQREQTFESVEFAKRNQKRRRKNALAKASRKKNR
jgi:hypothetical protein